LCRTRGLFPARAGERGGGPVRAERGLAGGVPGAAVDRLAEYAAASAAEQPPVRRGAMGGEAKYLQIDLGRFWLGSAPHAVRTQIGQFSRPGDEPFFLIAAHQEVAGAAAGNCCSGLLGAGPGPVSLEGGGECLDVGMARCPAPYGGEDLSPGTTVELVWYHVVPVTGARQVG
jgi:hypothetical protein